MKCFIGNHAIRIVCGKECYYESIAESFKEIFEEINKLIAEGGIEVDGERIQLEFYLGGDYKVANLCIIFHYLFIRPQRQSYPHTKNWVFLIFSSY